MVERVFRLGVISIQYSSFQRIGLKQNILNAQIVVIYISEDVCLHELLQEKIALIQTMALEQGVQMLHLYPLKHLGGAKSIFAPPAFEYTPT